MIKFLYLFYFQNLFCQLGQKDFDSVAKYLPNTDLQLVFELNKDIHAKAEKEIRIRRELEELKQYLLSTIIWLT